MASDDPDFLPGGALYQSNAMTQLNARSSSASFGGGGRSSSPSSPVNTPTTTGHQSISTFGANDYARVSIDGGGLNGFAGAAVASLQLAIAVEQFALAKKYYNTNKTDFDFYKNTYQNALLFHNVEAFNTPFYMSDFLPMTGAMLGRTKTYDEKWFQTRRRLHRYAVGMGRQVDYLFYMTRRKATMTSWMAGRRIEDTRKDRKDDQIQNHKIQSLNFGISAGNIARQGLASSANTLTHAFDEFGSRISGFGSGLNRYNSYRDTEKAAQRVLDSASQSGANMAPHAM